MPNRDASTHPIVSLVPLRTDRARGTGGRRILGLAAALTLSATAAAQQPFDQGVSLRYFVEHGLPGPAGLAYDFTNQILYASSLYNAHGNNKPTELFRVLADGTIEEYTADITDPDVIVIDSVGYLYVGSFGGIITRIDPSDGSQIQWKKDSRLANVDGMAFDLGGDLLCTAIDTQTIYRVDYTTKALTLFADLTSLGNQGYGSITVAPDGSVFVASPNDGNLIKLNPDGSVADPQWATGFLHMGQLITADGFLYASDTGKKTVNKYDLATQAEELWIRNVPDHSGGIVHLGGGNFYCSWQSEDNSDGGAYHVAPMNASFDIPPQVGGPFQLNLDSFDDRGRFTWTIVSFQAGSTPLGDGRSIPVDMSPGLFVILRGQLDANGHRDHDLQIPNDPSLGNTNLVLAYVSFAPGGVMGISEVLPFTILP